MRGEIIHAERDLESEPDGDPPHLQCPMTCAFRVFPSARMASLRSREGGAARGAPFV